MIDKFKSYLESIVLTPTSWLIGISSTLMVRFFLEALSSKSSSGIVASDASTLVHYYLFFLSFALGSCMFFYFAIPKWQKVLPQMVIYLFVLTLLAPILDFIISRGNGLSMAYIFYNPKDLFHSLLTFFGGTNGITFGIRIEVVIIILLSTFFIYKIQKSFLRAVIGAIILYLSIFVFVGMPSFISILSNANSPLQFLGSSITNSSTFQNNLHGTLLYGYPVRALEIGFNFLMGKIWFLVAVLLAGVWFVLNQNKKFIHIIKNSRPERVAFHLLAVCAGFYLAWVSSPPAMFSWIDVLSVTTLLLSFYFSWMFAVSINDIADEKIDLISNSSRPLITKTVSIDNMRQVSIIFLLASLIGGFLAGYYAFFLILTFTTLYYIYSAPPTRYKQIPFFSSFIIGLCVLSEVMSGFFLISASKLISAFPIKTIVAIVISVFLWSNIRDLKDIEGDSKEGIKTIPVLFGPVWGARVVGIMAALAYLLFPLFVDATPLFLLSVPSAVLTYYYSVKKPYHEKFLFMIYFLFVALLSLFLLIQN